MTLVSWALTASAEGVVDPSKTSFSFAYTKRAAALSETSSTVPFFRTKYGDRECPTLCVPPPSPPRGEWRFLLVPRILRDFPSGLFRISRLRGSRTDLSARQHRARPCHGTIRTLDLSGLREIGYPTVSKLFNQLEVRTVFARGYS